MPIIIMKGILSGENYAEENLRSPDSYSGLTAFADGAENGGQEVLKGLFRVFEA